MCNNSKIWYHSHSRSHSRSRPHCWSTNQSHMPSSPFPICNIIILLCLCLISNNPHSKYKCTPRPHSHPPRLFFPSLKLTHPTHQYLLPSHPLLSPFYFIILCLAPSPAPTSSSLTLVPISYTTSYHALRAAIPNPN